MSSTMISLVDPTFDCFGDLGDYASSANDLFAALAKSGVSGKTLNDGLSQLRVYAKTAPESVRFPFMYELESRAELKTDKPVPAWLLTQVRDRVKAMLAQVTDQAGAEQTLQNMRWMVPSTPAAAKVAPTPVQVAPAATAPVGPLPGAPQYVPAPKSSFLADYWLPMSILGVGTLAAVGIALLDRKPRPAMAELHGRRRRPAAAGGGRRR